MGLFSFGKKKARVGAMEQQQQQQQQQQVMYGPAGDGVSELGPVALTLDNNRLTYHNGHWSADFTEGPIMAPEGSLEKEVIELRREKRKLKRELDKYASHAQEMKDLKEKWNLLDFKYQLLVDMWSMRVLDNERITIVDKDGPLSPRRSSRKNSSTVRSN